MEIQRYKIIIIKQEKYYIILKLYIYICKKYIYAEKENCG